MLQLLDIDVLLSHCPVVGRVGGGQGCLAADGGGRLAHLVELLLEGGLDVGDLLPDVVDSWLVLERVVEDFLEFFNNHGDAVHQLHGVYLLGHLGELICVVFLAFFGLVHHQGR